VGTEADGDAPQRRADEYRVCIEVFGFDASSQSVCALLEASMFGPTLARRGVGSDCRKAAIAINRRQSPRVLPL